MPKASISRIVHYIMPDGQHRPAIIVKVHNSPQGLFQQLINLQVFTDGSNDSNGLNKDKYSPDFRMAISSGMFWATEVPFDDKDYKPHTWHWTEYVE